MVENDENIKDFDEQENTYNFRDPDLKKYRKEVKEVLKEDLEKRFKEVKPLKTEKITDEKKDNRNFPYGQSNIRVEFNRVQKGNKSLYEYSLIDTRSNKTLISQKEKKGLSKEEHRKLLFDKLEKSNFKYDKFYIKEDSESLKDTSSEKDVTVSYTTKYRYGIFIYRMRKGRMYDIIYQDSSSQKRSVYVSYQNIIAQIKQDVLNKTGIALEEWIYLSKIKEDISVEGGIKYVRYKGVHEPGRAFKSFEDYTVDIDFRDI